MVGGSGGNSNPQSNTKNIENPGTIVSWSTLCDLNYRPGFSVYYLNLT